MPCCCVLQDICKIFKWSNWSEWRFIAFLIVAEHIVLLLCHKHICRTCNPHCFDTVHLCHKSEIRGSFLWKSAVYWIEIKFLVLQKYTHAGAYSHPTRVMSLHHTTAQPTFLLHCQTTWNDAYFLLISISAFKILYHLTVVTNSVIENLHGESVFLRHTLVF